MSSGQHLQSRDGNHFFKVIINQIYEMFNENKRILFIQLMSFGLWKEYLHCLFLLKVTECMENPSMYCMH